MLSGRHCSPTEGMARKLPLLPLVPGSAEKLPSLFQIQGGQPPAPLGKVRQPPSPISQGTWASSHCLSCGFMIVRLFCFC